jgi:CDP-diacylglycerol--glycerol-3-phosphate 3-phosphatidyltransferase
MFLYLEHDKIGISSAVLPFILLFLLTVAELSDAFDGYFARKLHQVTDLGKLLDPMADSIYRISIFLTFTRPPIELPIALVFVFLYRDAIISTLRTVCALRGFALAARSSGKIKAILQASAAFLTLFAYAAYEMGLVSKGMLGTIAISSTTVAAIYAMFAGIEYLWANKDYVLKLLVAKGQ